PERLLDHLRRPVPGRRNLLTKDAGNTVSETVPSGHLEEDEDVVAAVIREAEEEVGISVAREELRCVHVMHHRNPQGAARVGFFFRAESWVGEPANREPHKCSELVWVSDADDPPSDMVEYPAEALRQIQAGASFSLHDWE
ncbi:NUDIX domain-containing protein, partial [Actinoplanes sp. NPDC051346]|uniref:NUDIX domain-containing protein n=1 Tax=Actinoplanes sp. NPDC051346 TaxID=3155048 RepID=UPI0034240168